MLHVQYRFVLIMKMNTYTRGLFELKIILIIRENADLTNQLTHPFFGNMYIKNTKTKKKLTQENRSWGLTHPHTSELFSDFLFISNWQDLYADVIHLVSKNQL